MSLHFFPSLLRITNGRLDYYWQQSEDQRVAISIADAREFSTWAKLFLDLVLQGECESPICILDQEVEYPAKSGLIVSAHPTKSEAE
jgi:hypothetical protein